MKFQRRNLYFLLLLLILLGLAIGSDDSSTIPPRRLHGDDVTIVDASQSHTPSSESTFDYEVDLSNSNTTLFFHWNDPVGNSPSWEGRLVHTAPSQDLAPSWLAIGYYNLQGDTRPIVSLPQQVHFNSEAILGQVNTGQVLKYTMGGYQVGVVDGVSQMMNHSSLLQSSIVGHSRADGSVTTVLSFQKLLQETNEIPIQSSGPNLFLWAVGMPGTMTTLSHHMDRGAFTLDFTATAGASPTDPPVAGSPTDPPVATTPSPTATTTSGHTPLQLATATGHCGSTILENGKMLQVTPTLDLHWRVNDQVMPRSVSMALEYSGGDDVWLGVGFSYTGSMKGSTAVIGTPDGSVLKYDLQGETRAGVVVSSSQTLTSTVFTSGTTTRMEFTKVLEEPGEVAITIGPNVLLYAVGSTPDLNYHRHRGHFRIDFSLCSEDGGPHEHEPHLKHSKAFVIHGIIAMLAMAACTPFAVAVAWFRNFAPGIWIYLHVFFNFLAFVLTLVAVVIGASAVGAQGGSHLSTPHHLVGMILLVVLTVQVYKGFTRPPVERKEDHHEPPELFDGPDDFCCGGFIRKPETARALWKLFHRGSGIAILAMGIYQISSGMKLYNRAFQHPSSALTIYWIYVVVFAGSLVALKVWMFLQERRERDFDDEQDSEMVPVSLTR